MKYGLRMLGLSTVTAILVAGCGAAGNNSGNIQDAKKLTDVSNGPVTIRIAMRSGYLEDDEFQKYVAEPVKRKYPHITVEKVLMEKGRFLPDLLAAGEAPDMTVLYNMDMFELTDLQLDLPHIDLKTYNIEPTRFIPEALDAVQKASGKKEPIGLPYSMHFSALYYNKDIFDNFGIAYPKDGMSWEEARELAKKVTRFENGTQYRGLEFNLITRQIEQLSIPYVDPITKKAIFNNDKTKRVFEMNKSIFDIPGNGQAIWNNDANKLFVQTRTLAMLASNNILFHAGLDKVTDFNWDMVSYPTYPERPGVGLQVDAHIMSVTSTSKHKKEAFQVLATVVSEEVQLEIAKNGRISALNDPKIQKAFGENLTFVAGKNLQAAFKTKPAETFVATEYINDAKTEVRAAFKEVTEKGKDINTALREAEEKTNSKIQQKEAAKGGK